MAVVKVTLSYSDGSSHDFLSLADAVSMHDQPGLHPDVALTGSEQPAHEEVPAEVPAEVVPEAQIENTPEEL